MDIISLQSSVPQIISAFFGAFFAFAFFILGESWLESMRKRRELVWILHSIEEYVAFQIFTLEININFAQEISKISTPISIHVSRFNLSSVDSRMCTKLLKYKVRLSILMFIVHLKALNENATVLNTILQELSSISRIAMMEQREEDFMETVNTNFIKLKDKNDSFLKHLKSTRDKITPLVKEIKFTLWYEQSCFWQKFHFRFRQLLNSKYRDRIIKTMFT